MIDNQETQEKIAAEVRDLSKSIKHKMELGDYISVPMPTVYGKPLDVYYAELADRIEAAHKREVDKLNSVIQAQRSAFDAEQDRQRRAAPSDAAAMREALDEILETINKWRANNEMEHWQYSQLWDIANAALAEPPRNCDLYDSKEFARKVHEEYCSKYISAASNKFDFPMEFDDWLFATATKGETDGSK